MNILIAGGAGYIGSRLVPALQIRGHHVSVVDLCWFGNHLPEETGVSAIDVFELEAPMLRAYDVVVFLSGLSNDPMAEYSPSENFIQNGAAPAFLAYIAKQAGVPRFVYASSCSVYGFAGAVLSSESDRPNPGYPYGISKLQGEQAVLQQGDENFSVIALRKGTVSGWSPRMRLDLAINTMFKSAMKDGVITVNNPDIWRPILDINDAVQAYTRAIECFPEISGVYNIASGNYQIGELAEAVKAAVGTTIKIDVKHVPDVRNYKVSTVRAQAHLGFRPKGTVQTILRDLRNYEPLFRDWDNPQYYNIRVFRGER